MDTFLLKRPVDWSLLTNGFHIPTEFHELVYDYRCQMTGEKIGDRYAVEVVEAHHIRPFTESLNNDTSNIIILSPSYHRIVHAAKPMFNYRTLSFDFPNGLTERVKRNKHLIQA